MAKDREKVMIFKGGPEGGKRAGWFDGGGPPPVSIAVLDDNTYAVYQRSNIQPASQKIKYYYEFEKKVERGEK